MLGKRVGKCDCGFIFDWLGNDVCVDFGINYGLVNVN